MKKRGILIAVACILACVITLGIYMLIPNINDKISNVMSTDVSSKEALSSSETASSTSVSSELSSSQPASSTNSSSESSASVSSDQSKEISSVSSIIDDNNKTVENSHNTSSESQSTVPNDAQPTGNYVAPIQIIESKLSKDIYGGVFFDQNGLGHIYAVSGYATQIKQIVQQEAEINNFDPNKIIIDETNPYFNHDIYSVTQLEAANSLISSRRDELGANTFGMDYMRNGLVIMEDETADRNKIIEICGIDNITWHGPVPKGQTNPLT